MDGSLEHGERVYENSSLSKCAMIIMGNTGAGKSTFVNYLHGCTK